MNIKVGTLIELGGAKQSGSILVASSNSTYASTDLYEKDIVYHI
jgi:hypothetical protein